MDVVRRASLSTALCLETVDAATAESSTVRERLDILPEGPGMLLLLEPPDATKLCLPFGLSSPPSELLRRWGGAH
jgi:hypothetical protein